ncbi:hypothetical protein AB870_26020 [Pandoraea faecigallinarum]|uniref:Bacteriophage T7 tail fibre protein-like N-terminal domain-containing protein n=1 Tax=Pandoraea faecigallinarum TaxID=656179 RepID=A0A173H0D4_9BURK|nr:phage tail fiber protein [Pandoraea faecigallinarum]ANI21761.1 hypothetical protein AB870_26020 [Pandoraea faecigallinarum]
MANEQLLPWINSAGAGGERNSMVSFPCDGKRTAFEFNFAGGYIGRANIKAYTYEQATGLTSPVALVPSNFLGPNTLSITPAIPAGFYLVVYRDTQKTVPLVNYATGAVMDEKNLDMSNQQAVFVAAEMVDRFDAINASSADAVVRSVEAVRKADEALTASGKASTDAADALAASGQAVRTANEAKTTADGIDAKATKAMEDGAAAVLTADAAKVTADAARDTANGIDGKAQQALDNSVGATNIATNAQTVAQTANTTANGVDSKASAALAMASALRDQVSVLFGVLGSTADNANWSPAFVSAGTSAGFRLKVKRGVLARPGSAAGTLAIQNVDLTCRVGVVGALGQDGSIPATGAIIVRVFLVYNDTDTISLIMSANTTPNLVGTVYKYAHLIALFDMNNRKPLWEIKLDGARVRYFSPRGIYGDANHPTNAVRTFGFLNGVEGVSDVGLFLVSNIVAGPGVYGGVDVIVSSEGGGSTLQQGDVLSFSPIAYGTPTSSVTCRYYAREWVPVPPTSWKVYTRNAEGNIASLNVSLYAVGYTVNNNAVN